MEKDGGEEYARVTANLRLWGEPVQHHRVVGQHAPLLDRRLGMETSIVQKRLVEAAVLAELPRPSNAPGKFKIVVETHGIMITYAFDVAGGTYAFDYFTIWHVLAHGVTNPLVAAMKGLLAEARGFRP